MELLEHSGDFWGFVGFFWFGFVWGAFCFVFGMGFRGLAFCVCARVLCLGIFFVCCFGFFCGFLLLVGWLGGWVVSSLPR